MLRWFAAFALLLTLAAASALAQGFQAYWIYAPENGAPLTTTCPPQGTTPLPEGRIIRIFWDVDSDGVDQTDPLAPLCAVPPQCEEGPPATFNYNEFTLNGPAVGLGAGYFYSEYGMDSHSAMPDPPRYYLRIYEADGVAPLWTSAVRTMLPGLQDINFTATDWVCGGDGPQCVVRDEHE